MARLLPSFAALGLVACASAPPKPPPSPERRAAEVLESIKPAGNPQLERAAHAKLEAYLERVLVGKELEASGYGQLLAAGMIFTGGGSLLRNLDQLGEEVLGVPVRIGAPLDIIAPESVQDPRYTTAIGLLRFATDPSGQLGSIESRGPARESWLGRIARFFSFL